MPKFKNTSVKSNICPVCGVKCYGVHCREHGKHGRRKDKISCHK